MKLEQGAQTMLSITNAKAKMYEFGVAEEYHLHVPAGLEELFPLTIGILGDVTNEIIARAKNITEELPETAGAIEDSAETLKAAARFFDKYIEAKFDGKLDQYLFLLGSASYYLCDLPGSSKVLINQVESGALDLECEGFDQLMYWMLRADERIPFPGGEGVYKDSIQGIVNTMQAFFDSGTGRELLLNLLNDLRDRVYVDGGARQILFIDTIYALAIKRLENSTWEAIPKYSELPTEMWEDILKKESFITELWPAQHLLGESGVFRGESAVIQMPTSAGKTKATEIIIRSAFLSEKANFAIVVAPFRALSREIRLDLIKAFQGEGVQVTEFTDTLQEDFNVRDLLSELQQVIVSTPEKLLYVLRHVPEIAKKIGLIIYDEGHQFDSGTRGITYELLLTSLKGEIPEDTQSILISAVISNPREVGEWLHGHASPTISGSDLAPTDQSVAFASWIHTLGQVQFVNKENPEEDDYFVPRVIRQHNLGRRGKELTDRLFPVQKPESDMTRDTALFLGLQLVSKGIVAIFCGMKSSIPGMERRIQEMFDRGLEMPKPVEFSDQKEVNRLYYLYSQNFGESGVVTENAAIGIYSHHGNTPQGIRLAIEHAMQRGMIRYVICTSTLAQGVNLPIRYLIVRSTHQGKTPISTRDFQNLAGRAGRAGMHTEGNIIFANPRIYDRKQDWKENYKWQHALELLDQERADPCGSTLLQLAVSIEDEIGIEPIREYARTGTFPDINDSEIHLSVLKALESYLMAYWDILDPQDISGSASELASETLAYFLANENQKRLILEIFEILVARIQHSIPEDDKKETFGRTLLGLDQSLEVESWVNANLGELTEITNANDFVDLFWSLFINQINNKFLTKSTNEEAMKEFLVQWMEGVSFGRLLQFLNEKEVKYPHGEQRRNYKLNHVVEICENKLGFEANLIVAAVIEILRQLDFDEKEEVLKKFFHFQISLKHGLASAGSLLYYNIGFSDRVIAQELAEASPVSFRWEVLPQLRLDQDSIRRVLEKYPSYFTHTFETLLAEES